MRVSAESRCPDHRATHGWRNDRQRGNRHQRGYGAKWDKIKPVVLARDGYLCQPCQQKGRLTPANAVDHIVNKATGGDDSLVNLQSICTECHKTKTNTERGR